MKNERINMNLKNVLKFCTISLAGIFFSGCVNMGENATVEYRKSKLVKFDKPFMLNKPINKTKIYIDDSLEKKRNQDAIDYLYARISSRHYDGDFKKLSTAVPNDHGADALLNFLYIEYEGPYKEQLTSCLFNCEHLKIDPKYVKRISNGLVFENFNTKEEILSAYRKLEKDYNFGITATQVTFMIDPKSYEEHKLILTDGLLKKYAMNEYLEKSLKKRGFLITKDKKDADLIFKTLNMGFGITGGVNKELRYSYARAKQPLTTKRSTSFFNNVFAYGNNSSSTALGGAFIVDFLLHDDRASGTLNSYNYMEIYSADGTLLKSLSFESPTMTQPITRGTFRIIRELSQVTSDFLVNRFDFRIRGN